MRIKGTHFAHRLASAWALEKDNRENDNRNKLNTSFGLSEALRPSQTFFLHDICAVNLAWLPHVPAMKSVCKGQLSYNRNCCKQTATERWEAKKNTKHAAEKFKLRNVTCDFLGGFLVAKKWPRTVGDQ